MAIIDYHLQKTNSQTVLNILEFIDTINIRLFPMQRLIIKMQHGIPLEPILDPIVIWDDLKTKKLHEFYHEKNALEFLYKNGYTNLKNINESKFINDEILMMGRRATKSTLTTYINTSYDLYKLCTMDDIYKVYNLFENATIQMAIISNKKGNTQKQFKELKSAVLSSPLLSSHLVPTRSSSQIRFKTSKALREDNEAYGEIEVNIETASDSTRGGANIKVILDEMEYYIKAKKNPLDFKVYDAVTPSTSTFTNSVTNNLDGKTVITTTPKDKTGLLYSLVQGLRDDPNDDKSPFLPLRETRTLFVTMPSHWLNPTISSEFLAKARKRSKISFDVEMLAKFVDIKGSFLADVDIDLDAIADINNDIANLNKIHPNYVISLDLATRTDRVPITVLSMEQVENEDSTDKIAYMQFQHTFWTTDKTYKTKKVFVYLANLAKRLPTGKIVCVLDQYSFDIAMELVDELKSKYPALKRFKFVEQTATALQNHLEAELLVDYGIDNRIHLINDDEFKRELLLLEKEYLSNNYIKVEAPTGEHDDRYDGLVRALYWLDKNYNPRIQATRTAGSVKVKEASKSSFKDDMVALAKKQNRNISKRKGYI